MSPTETTTTMIPTESSTTMRPTEMTTTLSPTLSFTTVSPTIRSSTGSPSLIVTSAPTLPGSVSTSSTMSLVISQANGRLPAQAEIDEFMVQLSEFYTDVLTNVFGADLQSYTATETSSISEVAGNFTISLVSHEDVTVFVDGATIPSQAEVDQAIQNADLTAFVEDYIPNVLPDDNIYKGTILASSTSTTGSPTAKLQPFNITQILCSPQFLSLQLCNTTPSVFPSSPPSATPSISPRGSASGTATRITPTALGPTAEVTTSPTTLITATAARSFGAGLPEIIKLKDYEATEDDTNIDTCPVASKLSFKFFPNTGREPTIKEISALINTTAAFFTQVFQNNRIFKPVFRTLELTEPTPKYSSSSDPDLFILEFLALIDVNATSSEQVSGQRASRVMSACNYATYIGNHVRKMGSRNEFYQTRAVHFVGVSHKG
ncbi:expressed unknown protein [Seminavis robusta]|uniref:Uncharacterized protein n=1 Tax=Seminavis robusta TaxID=568900 RepID=A0A9N8DTI2_9STRA|nr:expressed unknown protein [Seminavis robusta]|eukprot:Sro340_g121290.1 n/a (434) ;mRNA; f:67187-68488